jgi:hypothetical protein
MTGSKFKKIMASKTKRIIRIWPFGHLTNEEFFAILDVTVDDLWELVAADARQDKVERKVIEIMALTRLYTTTRQICTRKKLPVDFLS